MDKGTGVQWWTGYALKRHSTGRTEIEDEVEGDDFCEMWRI